MAEGAWSQSTCDSRVWWYGLGGQGCYYWTAEHGMYYVSGGIHAAYAAIGYECGLAKEPVKAAGWISEMNNGKGCPGQWFANCAIGFHDGAWRYMFGFYGQHHLVQPEEVTILEAPYVEPTESGPPPKWTVEMRRLRKRYEASLNDRL